MGSSTARRFHLSLSISCVSLIPLAGKALLISVIKKICYTLLCNLVQTKLNVNGICKNMFSLVTQVEFFNKKFLNAF